MRKVGVEKSGRMDWRSIPDGSPPPRPVPGHGPDLHGYLARCRVLRRPGHLSCSVRPCSAACIHASREAYARHKPRTWASCSRPSRTAIASARSSPFACRIAAVPGHDRLLAIRSSPPITHALPSGESATADPVRSGRPASPPCEPLMPHGHRSPAAVFAGAVVVSAFLGQHADLPGHRPASCSTTSRPSRAMRASFARLRTQLRRLLLSVLLLLIALGTDASCIVLLSLLLPRIAGRAVHGDAPLTRSWVPLICSRPTAPSSATRTPPSATRRTGPPARADSHTLEA